MTPDQILAFAIQGGAVAALIALVWMARRGDLRFRPGIDGELKAKDDALADVRAQRDRLATAVEKLTDALESRNRRDERVRRGTEPDAK